MRDEAHEWTDEQIAALVERIRLTYRSAQIDVQGKLDQFLRRFRRDETKFREKLEKGEITQETYRDWLAGQVFQGKHWRTMLATLTDTLTHADELAAQIVNDATPDAFSYNANWAAYKIESGGNINVGFELVDRSTVTRLLRDVPDLLPNYKIDIPEDKRWNRQAITHQINLGIIGGEALDTIAKRLQRVTNMDFNAARTNARTAMTGAQNAGRMETYRKAEELGIEGQKEWLATLDNHTRHAHAMLDGQKRPRDEPFDSELGEIMYPGDPNARPANTYNCRCTLIYDVVKYPKQNSKRRPNLQEYGDAVVQKPIKDMTYAEWAGWKDETKRRRESGFIPAKTIEEAEAYAQKFVSKYKSSITGNVSYKGMDLAYANSLNKVLSDVYDNYDINTPIRNIQPINFRKKEFKNATMEAAYHMGVGDLYFNQNYFKSEKAYSTHIKEIDKLMGTVIGGVDKLLAQTGISSSKRTYLEALKRTGVQCFSQKTDNFVEATFVHEMGHFLYDRVLFKTIKDKNIDWAESREKFSSNISGYATSTRDEYIAESFTAFWYGHEDLIDPKLAEAFKEGMKK